MQEAYYVAENLRTRYESKKHGGYDIYEDDKIIISSDTYYPNLSVYVKDGDQKILVLSRSGHGYNQEYHPGKWEDYIRGLMTKAKEVFEKREAEQRAKEQEEKNRMVAPANDAHIFEAKP